MKIFSLLIALTLAFPALGEELAHFPGWKINKIEQESSDDGSYYTGPEYYGLTPPDERPAISIDARTAKLLMAGQAQPEEVYGRSAPKKEGEKAESGDDQYVYSAGNNGFVQADEIASTLPGYQPVVISGPKVARGESDSFAPGETGSYGGASAAGGNYDGGSAYGGAYGGAGTFGQGGSGMSPELARQAAAASPAAAQAAARAASQGRDPASSGSGLNGGLDAANPLVSNGLKMANSSEAVEANGSSSGSKSGSKGGTNGTSGRWGMADDEDAPPPPCKKGRFVYDKPTLVRLKLPDGCGLIHISAWGAGGGSGKQVYSQGRDGGESIRNVPGVAGSFMSTSWEIDARKYDLVVVVGEAGSEAVQKTIQVRDPSGDSPNQMKTVTVLEGGPGGFPEGANGTAEGSGGGGGYSGVFLIPKSDGSKTLNRNRAMAVGAGGAGGNRGGAGGSMNVPSTAPDARLTNQIGEKAKGTKAGFHYYPERGGAATPGSHGKVILEYF